MKRLSLLFSLFFFAFLLLNSQVTKKCGTIPSEKQLKWLKNYLKDPTLYPITKRSVNYIPLKIHIVGDDNGNGYYSIEDLLYSICTLNGHYEPLDIQFYIYGDLEYINNSDYYEHSQQFTGTTMFFEHNDTVFQNGDTLVPLNLYFVEEPRQTCGYYSPLGDAIAIKKTCQTDGSTTMTHEIGHYFSLMHTFYGWEDGTTPLTDKQEKMDGSNCTSPYDEDASIAGAGDGFCDTPPDYLSSRWGQGGQNCNSGTLTDPNGVNFTVDGGYYMSYADDVCHDRFSTEQKSAILSNMSNERPHLPTMGQPSSTSEVTSMANIIEPLDGATNVPYNWVAFQWDAVPGASGYNVVVSENATFLSPVIDIYTTNKYHIAELTQGENYYWKIKAVADGNTCGSYNCSGGDCPEFTVGSFSNIGDKNSEIKVFPNILQAQQASNINVRGFQGSHISLNIFNIAGQLVQSEVVAKESLFIKPLPSGLYSLVLEDKDRRYYRKLLVKNK